MKFKMKLIVFVAAAIACLCPMASSAQDIKLSDHTISFHGFVTQGGIFTSGNNWLTMNTNGGSGAFTEMGLNVSTKLADKLRISAQVYDHNVGQLGQWHPTLDFAMLDYKFKPWLSVRLGKVKTTLGLFTDTQDLDFLHAFALMPQGIYPIDVRDANIAHLGGDIYGTISLGRKRGSLSYTGWGGHNYASIYSGYPYFLQARGTQELRYDGTQYGGDLRWQTPLKGLLVGASRMNEDLSGFGIRLGGPNLEQSKKDYTNQFYGEYTWRNLIVDAEAKRFYRNHLIRNLTSEDSTNVHAWYVSGSYRFNKWVQVGSYYSHYTITSTFLALTDTSTPAGHDYDKVVSGRVDFNRYLNIKIEGHFMDGYGFGPYPNGFYPQQNPVFANSTRALVLLSSFNF